jgi:integrase/recombinase XerD
MCMGAWNKGQKLPVETLSPDEVRALLDAPSRRAPTGVRNRAIVAVLYRSGLRISEALSLQVRDVAISDGAIRVHRGKGSRRRGAKARTVGIDPGGCMIVQTWLRQRVSLGITEETPLFCTLKGRPVSARYVRAALTRYGKRAGISKRVHPHGLRHTHAAELAREGVPVNTIQAQVGHANLATTSAYLAHIAPMELITVIQRRRWS